ncbi:hypothetical protein GCWU000342_00412 [Shuttleworthella satelles DSM 14600]|uniref:Uncharacterized protein n=1 Tax=Shuttleworthella satelles DSM 14600 TaxID=626523 RepID=C4G8W5_9FIRM|nr:hypothetical protein GCWU000342_00412 [Shuttleworthia satelles DSM 14600]
MKLKNYIPYSNRFHRLPGQIRIVHRDKALKQIRPATHTAADQKQAAQGNRSHIP